MAQNNLSEEQKRLFYKPIGKLGVLPWEKVSKPYQSPQRKPDNFDPDKDYLGDYKSKREINII